MISHMVWLMKSGRGGWGPGIVENSMAVRSCLGLELMIVVENEMASPSIS